MARYRILPSHNGAIDYDRAVEADAIEPLADGSAALTMSTQDIVAIIPAGYLIFREPDEAVELALRDPDDVVAAIKSMLNGVTLDWRQADAIENTARDCIDWSIIPPPLDMPAHTTSVMIDPLAEHLAVAAEEASKEEPEG